MPNLPCITCGYALTGLDENKGRCPECGTWIWISIERHAEDASPEAKASRRAKAWLWSLLFGVLAGVIVFGAGLVGGLLVFGAAQFLAGVLLGITPRFRDGPGIVMLHICVRVALAGVVQITLTIIIAALFAMMSDPFIGVVIFVIALSLIPMFCAAGGTFVVSILVWNRRMRSRERKSS